MTRMLEGLGPHDTLGECGSRLGPFDISLPDGKAIRQKDHEPIGDRGRNGIETRGGEIEIVNRYGKTHILQIGRNWFSHHHSLNRTVNIRRAHPRRESRKPTWFIPRRASFGP